MRVALISDIHANLTALSEVLEDVRRQNICSAILCGDLIDYGPRPNEVVSKVRESSLHLYANIWGNHEASLFQKDLSKFSSDRGRKSLMYTKSILSSGTLEYIRHDMECSGRVELEINGKTMLVVHGSIDNPMWGKISVSEIDDVQYSAYDYIISGHTHIPHYIENYYPAELPALRNKKKTVFINPGSVGQPRNQCSLSQYGILDVETGCYEQRRILYDISLEQSFFSKETDSFYRDRLRTGI